MGKPTRGHSVCKALYELYVDDNEMYYTSRDISTRMGKTSPSPREISLTILNGQTDKYAEIETRKQREYTGYAFNLCDVFRFKRWR